MKKIYFLLTLSVATALTLFSTETLKAQCNLQNQNPNGTIAASTSVTAPMNNCFVVGVNSMTKGTYALFTGLVPGQQYQVGNGQAVYGLNAGGSGTTITVFRNDNLAMLGTASSVGIGPLDGTNVTFTCPAGVNTVRVLLSDNPCNDKQVTGGNFLRMRCLSCAAPVGPAVTPGMQAVSLSSPASGAVNINTSGIFLSWIATGNAPLAYNLYLDNANGTTLYAVIPNGSTSYTIPPTTPLLCGTTYTWRVVPVNCYGEAVSPTSCPPFSFTTTIGAPTVAPTLSSPTNNATAVALNTFISWGSVTGASLYDLYLDAVDGSTLFRADIPSTSLSLFSSAQYYPFIPALNCNTTYYWRVVAKNACGNTLGVPSFVSKFTTINAVPSCPVISAPLNNATNVAQNPTISWGASANAYLYDIYLDQGTNNPTTLFRSNWNSTSITIPPSQALNCNTTYSVRIVAKNSCGESSCSTFRTFTTASSIPTCPTLSAPANAAINQSSIPTLSWTAVTGAYAYDIYLDNLTGPNAATTLYRENWLLTSIAIPPSAPLCSGSTYSWRVVAKNLCGQSSGCTPFTFNVINPNISCPTVTSPSNLATAISLTPSISWTAVTGALFYDVYLDNSTGTTLYAGTITTTSLQVPAVNPLLCNTTYSLRVVAKNECGIATGCATTTFTTINTAPTTPTLTTPGVAANVFTRTPAFVWLAATNATSYNIYVNAGAVATPSTLVATLPGNITSFSMPNATQLPCGAYSWRVEAVNCVGTTTSTTGSFTVTAPVLNPTLTPANAAINQSTTPTLSWTSVTGATGYDIFMCSGSGCTPTLYVSNLNFSQLSYIVPFTSPLLCNTQYSWRVVPKNACGPIATPMAVNTFTTVNPVSTTCATLSTPTNVATAVSLTPTLTWISPTSPNLPQSFDLYLDNNTGPTAGTTFITNLGQLPGTATPQTSYLWPQNLPLLCNTTYTWRVVPRYCGVTSTSPTSCTAFTFTTINTGTVVPTVTSAPAATTFAPICGSGLVTLTASSAPVLPGVVYQWLESSSAAGPFTPVVGGVGANTTSYQRFVSATTFFQFRATAIAPGSCTPALSATYTVNVSAPPTISVTPPGAISFCPGFPANSPITVTSSVNSATITPAATVTGTYPNYTLAPTASTVYTITTSDPATGCTSSTTKSVNIGSTYLIGASANPTSVCNPFSTTVLTAVDTVFIPASSYCTPTISSTGASGDFINNFSFSTLSNLNSGDNASDYALYPQTTTVAAGTAYTISAQAGPTFGVGIGVWIDYNKNGSFNDPGEFVINWPSSTVLNTGSITIPLSAANGPTRLRVGCKYNASVLSTESCAIPGFGEFEDYNITITGGNGMPPFVANTLPTSAFTWTSSSPTNIATNPNKVVSVTGVTTQTVFTVTATDAIGCTFTKTTTVDIATPVVVTGVSGVTTYCSATPSSALTVQTTGGSTPINTFWLGGPIVGATNSSCLTLNGFSGSLAPANWTPAQSNSNGTVNTSGAPSNIVITSGNNTSGTQGITQYSYVSACNGTVNFDWNYTTIHGAAFDYPQYQINSGTPVLFTSYNTAAGITQSGTQSITVAIGDTVKLQAYTTNNLFGACTVTISNFSAPGLVGMTNGLTATVNPPVGTTTYTVIAMDACGTTSSTTVSVTVNPTPSLTMTPGTFNLCAGSTVTEVASGSGSATVYTWMPGTLTGASQVLSPTSNTVYTVTATDGPCSTTTAFTVTYVTLPVISSANANPANVCNPGTTVLSCTDTINGPTGLVAPNSYGSSIATQTTEDEIFNVSLGAWSNASDCNTTGGAAGNTLPASIINRYSNYTTSAITFPSLNAGASVSGSITYRECSAVSGTVSFAVYIDFNRNGVWDLPGEQAVLNTGLPWPSVNPTTIPFSFTVPATAVPGQTLMRIIQTEGTVTGPTFNPGWGETEDYIVTIRKSSGLPNTSFVWSGAGTFTGNPGKSVTVSNILSSSVYTITATDLVGCSTSSTVSVNMATPVVVTGVSGTTTYCSVAPNTVLTVNTQNGSTPFTAVWTGGPIVSTSGMNATVNPPVGTTTYTVTVTDACGTASTTTVDVTVNPTPTVSVSPGTGNLCLGSISNQTASGSGSAPVYTWMPGSLVGSNQALSPAGNSTYTVTATDGPCSATSTFAITVTPIPVFSSISATPSQICPGDVTSLTSTATLTVGNQGPQAYTVNSIPYSPLVPVTSTLANAGPSGDEGTTIVTLPFTFFHYGIPKTTVYIHTNGYVLFSPYVCCTYTSPAIPDVGNSNDWFGYWSDLNASSGQISYQIFGTAPNRYLVVNYNNVPYYSSGTPGYSGQVVIYENQQMDVYLASVNSTFYPSVVGTENATGTVATAATGLNNVFANVTNQAWRFSQFSATPVTNYAWSPAVAGAIVNPAAQTTTANPTANTVYTVTATGSNGCTKTNTTTVLMKPTVTGTVSAAPAAYCVGGSSTLNGSVPVVCGPNQANFTAYYAPATWTLVQSNANGSVNTASAPASISITSGTNSSFIEGFTNYRHTFGCSGNVTFNWSYTSADLSFSDRPRYKINSGTEVDFPGFDQFLFATPQSGTATIPVNTGDTLTIQMYTTDNDGVPGTVTISNWNAPAEPVSGTITFWDAPTGGTQLSSTPYTVSPIVTTTYYAQFNSSSALACNNPVRQPVLVTVNQLPVMTAAASPNPLCFGSSAVLNGTGASTYTWNPGSLTAAPTVTPTTTTTYTVTGVDANGCSNTTSVTLVVNSLPIVSAVASNTVICNGQTSTLTGNGAVTYTWEPGSLTGSPTVSPNVTTTYTMTGTDANGCNSTATVQVVVNQLPSVIASAAPSTICQNVSTSLNASGASTYSWMPGNLTGATVTDFPMATTVYTVTGTDGNGCTNTSTTTVNVNVLPTVTASNNASPICFGFSSGLSATGGVSYAWQPGNLTGAPTVNPATTTIYTMTATDANGCTNTATTEVVVNQLPPIVITPTLSAICLGFNTTLNVTGASTYAWQPGSLTGSPTVSPASATTYTVTGTDVNGCVSTSSVTIDVYLLPNITATASPSTICNGFSSTLTANGGATYSWQPGNLTGAPTVTPNASTTYTVVGTDAAGCSNTTTVGITVLTPPSVFASGPNNAFCQGGSGIIAGFSIPSIPSGSFVWQPGNLVGATKNVAPATTTVYTVTATAANGCTGTATWNVQINALPVMNITATPAAAVCMSTPQVTLTANGANTYAWTGGITNGNAFNANLGTTTYTVTGTSVAGCTSTTTTSVTGNANPTVAVNATPSNICNGNTAVLTATGNGASYSWSSGANTATTTVQPTTASTYTVTSTSAAGCTNSTSVTVNVTTGVFGLATTTSADTNAQPDGMMVTYTNSTCNLILSITDNVPGQTLGNTVANMTISPTVQTYNGQPYLNRWYQITPANNLPAMLTFYVNQFDFDMYNTYATANNWPLLPTGPADATGIANVRVTKVTNAGLGNNPVVLTPNSVTWNSTFGYWEIITATPDFSQFYVHSVNPNNVPLPATITRFDGRKMDNANRLEWTTVSEQNNSHFMLQYSTDGSHFTDLAKVDSKAPNGNSNDVLNYSYDHTNPALGHNYYRLQQMDIDGKKSYHANVVDLIWGSNGSTVSVYPNPSQGVVNIDLYTVKAQNTLIKVLDMSGRIVKQIEARSEAGMNKLSVDLGDVAQGIYTLQVFENGQMTFVERVRKAN